MVSMTSVSANRVPIFDLATINFLDTKDVERVLIDGSIVISSFDRFRNLEETKWGAIADRLESQTELTFKEGIVAREGSPELEMLNDAKFGLGLFSRFASITDGAS